MKTNKALLIVDAQNDFCEGGPLEIKKWKTTISRINKLIPKFDLVIFTKQWTPKHNVGLASSYKNKEPFLDDINVDGENYMLWPDYCIQNTPGAALVDELNLNSFNKVYIIKKGNTMDKISKGAFYNDTKQKIQTGLHALLKKYSVQKLYITGFGLDHCIKETAIQSYNLGYTPYIILDACEPIFQSNYVSTLNELQKNQINIIEEWMLLFTTL